MADPVAGVTHHIVLDDGTTKLGLLSADNMATFVRIPASRTSLKTSQGDTLYSDLETPYNTQMQESFVGGRAQKNFRLDPKKFYDSWNVDTRFEGQCTLGPKLNLAICNAGIPEYTPGSVTDVSIPYTKFTVLDPAYTNPVFAFSIPTSHPTYGERSQSFTAINSQLVGFDLYLYITANQNATVTVYADSSGPSGAALGTKTVAVTGSASAQWVTFTFAAPLTLTIGNSYCIVLTIATAGNWYYYNLTDAYTGGGTYIYTGSSWAYYSGTDLAVKIYWAQTKRSESFNYAGAGAYAVTQIQLYLKKVGTSTPTVRIETNAAGIPSGTLAHANATATLADTVVGTSYSWVIVTFTSFNLNYGTTYHVVVTDGTQRDQTNMLYWGSDGAAAYSGGSACLKIGSAAWAADATQDFYFRLNNGQALTNPAFKFFQYKGAMYCVECPVEGTTAGKLWLNGDRGTADSNAGALTTLVDATKGWTVNGWAGCIAKITAGTGKGEYRTIASNTATVLTVSTAWTTTHDTTTEYVILGSDTWQDVSPAAGDLIDAPVTDVLVANGIIYFACGDSQNILRYQGATAAGAWTVSTADDGTNKATLLLTHKGYIWRAASTNQVSKAPVVAWGTNLTFATAINIGTSDSPITSLLIYDSDLWVGKEDSLWSVKSDVPEEIPVDFSSLASGDNSRRMKKFNVYLFFPLAYGLERQYGLQIDDMGPNRDEGLPSGRQGPISDVLAMPGLLYTAIDAGDSGTSSILCYNEFGWHEFVRATASGKRIRAIGCQVIPGGPNRFWFGMGTDVAYVKIPSKGINPLKDSAITYAASGELITSWIDLHLADILKYFNELKIVAENLTTGVTVTAYYQLDGATDSATWVLIGTFDTSPVEELSIGVRITGRRIRFKFAFVSNSATVTPNLVAYTLDSLARIAPKSRFEPLIKLDDNAVRLDGAKDDNTRHDIVDQLDTWAGIATPLTMTSCDPAFTNMSVFLEPLPETAKKYEMESLGQGKIVECRGRLIILEA